MGRTCIRLAGPIAALAVLGQAGAAGAAEKPEKPASLYVQCDGNPNNMTAGESVARLVAITAVVGLLAPSPEAADPSKRKFGGEGVAACSSLLDAQAGEGNPERRIDLFLARAIHRIEMGEPAVAIEDVARAREAASAAGFMADDYFRRSKGRSFSLIEGAALLRMGQAEQARDRLIDAEDDALSAIGVPEFAFALPRLNDAERQSLARQARALGGLAGALADRLEEVGDFETAARYRLAQVDYANGRAKIAVPIDLAQAALAQALVGKLDAARSLEEQALAARTKREAEGIEDKNRAKMVEVLDLLHIVQAAASGDMRAARRSFAARSEWTGVSVGQAMEVNRRLREGAQADELFGSLAKTPAEMWAEREKAERVRIVAEDKDNKSLFQLIKPRQTASSFETLSKNVWRTEKSRIVITQKKREPEIKTELLLLYGTPARQAFAGYMLHAALIAKARGVGGFTFMPGWADNVFFGSAVFGNRGDPGLPDLLFNDADQVIAALSPIIPSPETIKARTAKK